MNAVIDRTKAIQPYVRIGMGFFFARLVAGRFRFTGVFLVFCATLDSS